MVLLALAANTSFGGLPVLAALLAKDNYLPHMFGLRADRQVHRYGVVTLALLAAALLVAAKGDTQALVPLFAIGVFVGFTLSQVGMVRHWSAERSPGWSTRAGINAVGAVLTLATTFIELVSKFTEGAWLIVLVIPALVLLFTRIHRTYDRIGTLLELGQKPKPPPLDQPADRDVPVPPRGGGAVPPGGGADSRGAAAALLGLPAVQPARRDPGARDQAGHSQRRALPPPLPA